MTRLFQFRTTIAFLALVLILSSGCTRQMKVSRHLNRANKYYAAGDYSKAELEYINVLRLNGTNYQALRNLGLISYTDEMLTRAIPVLNAVKQMNTNDVEVRSKLARLYLTAGAPKEAAQEADFVLRNSPTNEEALLVLVDLVAKPEDASSLRSRISDLKQRAGDKALFHIASGTLAVRTRDQKAAETEFKSALALDANSALAHWALGSLYLSQTNLAQAMPELEKASNLSAIRSARRVRFAALKAENNDIEGAKKLLAEITSKAPDYIPALMLSARINLQQKDFAGCAANLDRALARDPDAFEPLSLRAEMYMAQNQPDKALIDLDRLTKRFPKSPAARYQLALAALASKDTQRALSSLNQAVFLDTNYFPAILTSADLNIRSGNPGLAISSLNNLLNRQPGIPRAYTLLASAYQAANRPDDALAVFARASKAFPNSPEPPFLAGALLRQIGRLDAARKVFEDILKAQPDSAQALGQLVEIDIAQKKYDSAITRIQPFLDRTPNNPEPMFQLAKVRLAQEQYKPAQELLEKVISLNPDAVPAYVMLANLYYKTKQTEAAFEKYNAALAHNPNDQASLLMIAMIYSEKADYEKARDYYERLLKVRPGNLIALNNLASLYSEQFHQLDKAYDAASRADELKPHDPLGRITDTLGWILAQRGDYATALAMLREAAQFQPADPEVLGHLGMAQYFAGDEASARGTLERALSLSDNFARRDEVQASLAMLKIDPATANATAVSSLEKSLQAKPTDQILLSRLAAIYARTGDTNKLIAAYEKALAANPKFAFAAIRLADIYDKSNNKPKAIDLAKAARKIDGDSADVAGIAGRITSQSADPKDQQFGLSLLQEANQKRPSDPSISFDLAWAYYTQGRLSEAETAVKAALANGLDKTRVPSAQQLADFIALADGTRASQQLAKIDAALQAQPNYIPALVARAAAAQTKGDNAAALKTWEDVLTRYPSFGPAIRGVAILSAEKPADAAKSLALATRARDLYPEDPQVNRALGILQYQRGEYQKAVRTLSDAAKSAPNDALVQYYLGMSHYKLKQNKESKTALTNAVRLQATASFVPDAQRVLAELK